MSKPGVGNLKWIDSYNCEQLAESDTDKAEALQKIFLPARWVSCTGESARRAKWKAFI